MASVASYTLAGVPSMVAVPQMLEKLKPFLAEANGDLQKVFNNKLFWEKLNPAEKELIMGFLQQNDEKTDLYSMDYDVFSNTRNPYSC